MKKIYKKVLTYCKIYSILLLVLKERANNLEKKFDKIK